ncbi:hypothetical protein V6N13_001674 [Hibiscus sabdariffa]|uniref:Uncharacterized protein n=1 Tax=Hibiscus sabdariffa TaxID=183260 RepID=A0ABR2G9X3_9ROSI
MSQKNRVPLSHRFTKSLPVDFRFMGYPTSDGIGYADISLGNNGVINLSSPERNGSGVKVVESVKMVLLVLDREIRIHYRVGMLSWLKTCLLWAMRT